MTIKRAFPLSRTTYKKCMEESAKRNEDNDCSVKAVAIAGRVTYDLAHKTLEMYGRRHRKGASVGAIAAAFMSIQASMIEIDRDKLIKRNGGRTLTVNNIVQHLSKSKNYVLYIAGHILAVKNGQVQDWTEGRRHHVTSIYEIVR